MSTFIVNTNNDLYLDGNNNIAMSKTNIEAIASLCNYKLKTFLSEIFTDISVGTDWFGLLLTNQTTIATKNQELTRVLLSVNGVLSVDEILYKQNNETREIEFIITVTCIYGSFTLQDLSLGG